MSVLAVAAVLLGVVIYLTYRAYKKALTTAVAQWGARIDPTCDDPTTNPAACARLLQPIGPPVVGDVPAVSEYAARAVGRFIAFLGAGDQQYLTILNMRPPILAAGKDRLPLSATWVSPDNQIAVVAIRGTKTMADFLSDVKYHETLPSGRSVSVRFDSGGESSGLRVHSGMYSAYLTIRDVLFASVPPTTARVLIAGHSMGAAIAYYYAHELAMTRPWANVTVVGFAPPRAGNAAFAAEVAAAATSATFINVADFVPSVPWSSMPDMNPPYSPDEFAHVGPVYAFNDRKRDVTACHSLLTYFSALLSPTPPVVLPGGLVVSPRQ